MSNDDHQSRHHRTALARVLLLIVFAILCAGNFAFWKFSFHRGNPFPAMPGLVVGCALASTVMIGAIWLRKPLARTALIVFLWLMLAVFSMPGLLMMSDRGKLSLCRATPAGIELLTQAQIIDGREVWASPLLYEPLSRA